MNSGRHGGEGPSGCPRWAGLVLFAVLAAGADDDRPAEFKAPEKVKPGQTGLLTAPRGMRYFLRVPEKLDRKRGTRLIVFCHGSNMNGLNYLRSFEARGWAEDALLACPNGEQGSDPFGANNFTFASAPLVADVTAQVQKAFKTTVTYIGGHSQGGFLTYSVLTGFPELYHGALPMAGDCWMQNEPNRWQDRPDVLAHQRRVAIAVIHGRADPVVAFQQGQHGYDCFRAMGWTRLRLFAPEKLGHEFMLSPVDEALDWLDLMNGLEIDRGDELLRGWAEAGEWGWVVQAVRENRSLAAKYGKGAEEAAARAAATLGSALETEALQWVPQWLEFWRVYGDTAAARPLVARYESRRDKQKNDGSRLFAEARSVRGTDPARSDELLRQLLDEAPCTYEAFYAASWLTAGE